MRHTEADPTLWAKMGRSHNPYPLIAHLLDTAASARVLWDLWLSRQLRDALTDALGGDPNRARNLVAYAAAVHDVGKANPVFQAQLGSQRPPEWASVVVEQLQTSGYKNADFDADWCGAPPAHGVRRHEGVSFHVLNGRAPQDLYADPAQSWVAAAALGHHGAYLDLGDSTGMVGADLDMACEHTWATQQDEHTATIRRALGVEDVPELAGVYAAPAVVLISGLVTLADHLSSEDASVAAGRAAWRAANELDPEQWLGDRERWLRERLPHTLGVYTNPKTPRDAVLPAGATPTELQADAEGVGGGLWIVMHPTGDGKTEASALRHMARDDEGLLFALPTRATADAIMDRVVRWYTSVDVIGGLAHGTSSLHRFYMPEQEKEDKPCSDDETTPGPGGMSAGDWYVSRLRTLLTPVTVATCDQVLAGALSQKWAPLRLLALANKHVVLDEVHTFDQYQTQLLCELLAWWGATGTRVTLLSATLPTWQRNMFAQAYHPDADAIDAEQARFPDHVHINSSTGVATAPDAPRRPRRAPYTQHLEHVTSPDPAQAHIEWACSMRDKYPLARLAVVVNTVDAAIEVAAGLRAAGERVLLLHSRMVAGHRATATGALLHELGKIDEEKPTQGHGAGLTVVGTQVIEASLDIDLDAMSTDLAPVPSLVQRAGRTWRFDDPRRSSRIGSLADLPGPTLRVVAKTDERGLLHERQAPYLHAGQARASAATAARLGLSVPFGVQRYVDEAAFSLADAAASVAASESGAEGEYRKLLLQEAAASRAKSALGGPDGLLACPTYGALIALTAKNLTREEGATRYIDRDSEQVVLIDPTGQHPFAMRATVESLAGARDSSVLRRALEATVPVSGAGANSWVGRMRAASKVTLAGGEWKARSGMLTHSLVVDVALLGGDVYDEFGLHADG